MNKFNGRTVLITGGSSGIGLALARLFTQNNANVWILARRADQNKRVITELNQITISPDQVIRRIVADVTNLNSMHKAVEFIQRKDQFPDIVINSAGVCHPGDFDELGINIFHWMMNVNYFGTVNVCKAVIPGMKERGFGHIVNISSMAGFLGIVGYAAYSPSKYAVRGFSDVLRAEMKPFGINISHVIPTDTETPQLEYEEQYKPELAKELVGNTGRLSADTVAKIIFKGIQKNRYIITPGMEGTAIYYLVSILGSLVYPVMDLMLARSMKKVEQKKSLSKN